MPTQWAVVADDSRARIFARVSANGSWQDIYNLTRRHLEPTSDGREQRLPPMSRQFLAANDFPRAGGSRGFLSLLAERLSSARKRGDYDQLLLVAPPALLKELRHRLDAATLRKLVNVHEADLVGLPVKTTQRELARMF